MLHERIVFLEKVQKQVDMNKARPRAEQQTRECPRQVWGGVSDGRGLPVPGEEATRGAVTTCFSRERGAQWAQRALSAAAPLVSSSLTGEEPAFPTHFLENMTVPRSSEAQTGYLPLSGRFSCW